MSDKHAATYHGSDLQRRRELTAMTKPELIEWIVKLEGNAKRTQDAINSVKERIDAAYGNEP